MTKLSEMRETLALLEKQIEEINSANSGRGRVATEEVLAKALKICYERTGLLLPTMNRIRIRDVVVFEKLREIFESYNNIWK